MWKLDIFVLLGLLVFFPASDCSWVPYCTKNGTQEDCPSFCPETCEFDGNGLCDRMCAGPCVCKPGYVIDERIPACVLRSDCPKDVVQQPGTTVIRNFNCFSKSKCVDMSHYY